MKRRVRVGAAFQTWTPIWALRLTMRMSRALGADDYWFGDHTRHFFPPEAWNLKSNPMARVFPSCDAWLDPTVVIARYSRRRGGRMGVWVTDPVRRSAADLARCWMSLHHLTGGKAVLGIGAGESTNYVPIGHSQKMMVSRLEDTIVAVRAAWASETTPLTHSGQFHEWNDALFLPSLKRTTPPIWVAAQGPRTCDIAGRLGDGWVFLYEDLGRFQIARDRVIAGAHSVGKNPNDIERSIGIYGAVLSTRDRFVRACRSMFVRFGGLVQTGSQWSEIGANHPFGPEFSGPHDMRPEMFQGGELHRALEAATPEVLEALMPCGTAREVAEQLEPFVEQGVSHIIYGNLAAAADWDIALDSLREQVRLSRLLKSMSVRSI